MFIIRLLSRRTLFMLLALQRRANRLGTDGGAIIEGGDAHVIKK
jgi:hypothetical protein